MLQLWTPTTFLLWWPSWPLKRFDSEGLYLLNLLSSFSFLRVLEWVIVTQLCSTLCDPMDGNPPGFSVHGILQARILEWVFPIPFSSGIFPTQGLNPVSCMAGRFFTVWATRETLWFILKWRIIALQCCIHFCHTSTWISHRYTYLPFLLNLLPSLLSRLAGCLLLLIPFFYSRGASCC